MVRDDILEDVVLPLVVGCAEIVDLVGKDLTYEFAVLITAEDIIFLCDCRQSDIAVVRELRL